MQILLYSFKLPSHALSSRNSLCSHHERHKYGVILGSLSRNADDPLLISAGVGSSHGTTPNAPWFIPMMLCTTHRIGRLIGYSPSLQARQTITHVEVCPDTAVRRDVSGPLIVATVAAVVECIWRVPLVEPGDVVSDHVHVLHDDALAGCVQRPVVCPTSHGLWAFPPALQGSNSKSAGIRARLWNYWIQLWLKPSSRQFECRYTLRECHGPWASAAACTFT